MSPKMRTNEFLLVREEEKPPEESPAKEATVEWADSGLPKDEDPLWIQTATPLKEFSSSAPVMSPPQEAQTSSLGGEMQEEKTQIAKGLSLLRKRNFLRSSQILEQPQTGLSSRSQAKGTSRRSHPKSGSPRERPGGSDRDQKVFRP